ncbi:MAG: type II toxin-antitoxin system HipA family toxin [Betaproteobacteria bacterium]|nr:type II toxin-antitoxin system HipA family toxin [Betaproteobacteria bacterium]
MTSDAAGGCFVYITLPGETVPVTAGRFVLAVDRRGIPEGRFVYGRSYLERPNAVALDPVELRLAPRIYATSSMGGLFGALRDASPDFWGRRIIQRHLGKAQPSEMEYLLHSPDDRAGALGFGLNTTPPKRTFNRTLDLATIQAIADSIVADEDQPVTAAPPARAGTGADHEQVEALLAIGTSWGRGPWSRRDGLWMAKFNRPDDPWNNARVEHAMLVLARACGLMTAESRTVEVAGRDVLLVKRFDREKTDAGYRRARMVSALTLLRAEDTTSAVVLRSAGKSCGVCADPQQSTAELFRRMCFNALISNVDDHPRNHAVIARDADWGLSPAYDLTPAVPVSLERRDLAMACGDAGRFANAGNLISQRARFLLNDDEARAIVDAMAARVRESWYAIARAAGVTARDCNRIAPAFVYPGFQQERTQPGKT